MNNKNHIKSQIEEIESEFRKSNGTDGPEKSKELLDLYEEWIALDDTDYFAYEHMARACIYLIKDYYKAISCLLRAMEKFSYNKVLFLLLSESYKKTNDFQNALNTLDTVINKEFSTDFLYFDRAELNRILGNTKEAEEDQKKFDEYQAREKAKWDDPNHYYNYK